MVEVVFRESSHGDFPVGLIGELAVGLKELHPDKDVGVPVAGVDDLGPDIGDDLLLGDLRNLAADPVHAVVLGSQVHILHHEEPHRVV